MKSFIIDLFTQGSPDGTYGTTLQGVVESIPHTPNRITRMGLHTPDFLNGTGVDFDVTDMTLSLIDPVARDIANNDPSLFVSSDPSNLVHFKTYSFKRSARVTETEIRDIRKMGEAAFETAKNVLARKLRKPVLEVRAAREWQMLGSIRGQIVNTAGTVTTDMFAKLGKTKPDTKYWNLDGLAGDGDFNTLCTEAVDEIQDELGADSFDHVHALVTSAGMTKIANLPECREAFRFQQGQSFLQAKKGYGTTFEYGGITFETYRGKVGGVDFLDSDETEGEEIVIFPVGASNFYAGYAPATRIVDPFTGAETEEGIIGQPEFYLPFVDPYGEYEEVQLQSHPLYLNLKPRTTIIARTGVAA